MIGVFVFASLFTLICAAWGFFTMTGLIRMRNWARISVMIIGGCIAAFSLLEVFGCIVMQIAMKNMVLPPDAGSTNLAPNNPAAMQGLFLFVAAMFACIAAIGIWWLVYFALRRTRDAFKAVRLESNLSGPAQLNPATPITDFGVAQPLDIVQPLESAQSLAVMPITESAPAQRERPISMTIVAVLLLFGAVSVLFCFLMPYHLFFFGAEVSGPSKYLLLIALGALNTVAGFGLLKRMHFGWLLAVCVQILGLLNMLTLLTPHVRERYNAYMQTVSQSMMPTIPNAAQLSAQDMQQKMMAQMMGPVFVLCAVFILFILVLLWRARWWYKSSE
jgi:hypothetical protein